MTGAEVIQDASLIGARGKSRTEVTRRNVTRVDCHALNYYTLVPVTQATVLFTKKEAIEEQNYIPLEQVLTLSALCKRYVTFHL